MASFQNVEIKCIKGNIANQPNVNAVVNAANAQLRTGGGVAGAIHRAAGAELAKECRPMAPIEPGQAVISGGHDLPNEYVIHCLGPVYGNDTPEDKLLADCYKNALQLAEEHDISSIAFPAISTGAFGYPIEDAAEISFKTIKEIIPELNSVEEILFVLFSNDDLKLHQKVMKKII